MQFLYIHKDIYISFTHDFSEILDAGSSLQCVCVENPIITHGRIIIIRFSDFYLDDF